MKGASFSNNPILNLTFRFALNVIAYCESIEVLKRYSLAKQLFRCGTSIGANANEAQDAESKAEFIHKFKIAAKEIQETKYWLTLCKESENYPPCDHLLQSLTEIEKVVNKIIATSKQKVL